MKKDNLVNKTYKMSVELCDDVSQNTENILKLKKEISTIHNHSHANKTILDNITASYTVAEQAKLSGIENNAQKNVQSNWNEQDVSNDAYIKNKPSIPANDSDLTNDRYVRYDISNQNLNSTEQSNARVNIGAVSTERTINSKALSGDITLTASDVGAVPTTRTVNSKVLSSDITLTYTDVGAEQAFNKNTAFNQNFETSTSNIKMNGTVSVGSSNNVARADHVHPHDTTKQDVLTAGDNITIQTINDVLTIRADKGVIDLTSSSIDVGSLDAGVYRLTYSSGDITLSFNNGNGFEMSPNSILIVTKDAITNMAYFAMDEFGISYGKFDGSTVGTTYTQNFLPMEESGQPIITGNVENNLTYATSNTSHVLSAYQGKVLKDEIDTLPDTAITINEIDALFS